nr:unnamed protein product [Callosobruchus chinensis]
MILIYFYFAGLYYFIVALNILSLAIYLTTSFKANFIDRLLWSKCLLHLRTALNIAHLEIQEPTYFTADFLFFGCTLVYGAICMVTILIFKTDCDYKEIFVDVLVNVSQIVVTNLVCNITEMIRLCYSQLESMLVDAFRKNYPNQYIICTIRNVKSSYLEINFAIDCQERVFGMTVALLYLRTVIAVVYFLATMANGDGTPAMPLFCRILIYAILPIMISFCSDSATISAEDLTDMCFELDIRSYSNDHVENEMESLKTLLVKQKTNFTAGRLFTTNRTTLLSTFSAAATYFIVFLQFWHAR